MPDLVLVYVTKSGNTRLVAEAIARGAGENGLDTEAFCLCDITPDEILKASAIAIGSPTYEQKMLSPVEKLLDHLGNEKRTGKVGIAFGSYGWSGEAPLIIAKRMREMGFDVLDPVMRIQYEPGEKDVEACMLLGKGLALKLKKARRRK
jgi:flavodoxin I